MEEEFKSIEEIKNIDFESEEFQNQMNEIEQECESLIKSSKTHSNESLSFRFTV